MASEVHDTVAERLRRIGQRYTANRRALVELLDRADHPLTIPQVLERGKRLPQSSVYRNLAVLEQASVVHRIVTSDEFARYELVEDLTEHHHHLICMNCGRVEDFTASPAVERSAVSGLKRAAARAGFDVKSHRLDLIGLCRNCG
jgi:Fe2+ or Zn2+ uptake regulation protein